MSVWRCTHTDFDAAFDFNGAEAENAAAGFGTHQPNETSSEDDDEAAGGN